MHPRLRTGLVVVIVAITSLLVYKILFGGPDPQTGRCVDGGDRLVACDARGAIFKLAREVDAARDCPSDARKLYTFRDKLFCGVALHGAPAPSSEYVSCLLLAGAKLAFRSSDLEFARNASAAVSSDGGAVTVTGSGWRIFYVLGRGQLDPGLQAIVQDPARATFVAYVADAKADAKQVAAAERCTPRPAGR